MRKIEPDPFDYIESAFVEAAQEGTTKPNKRRTAPAGTVKTAPPPTKSSPKLVEAIRRSRSPAPEPEPEEEEEEVAPKVRLKRTGMRTPRPRQRRRKAVKGPLIPEKLERLWEQVPKNLKFLAGVYDDRVTQKYYSSRFKEPREELIRRLMDPELNLEDTARLLGVCPATVRRYTNRGWLKHHRTKGNQRRFRLSGIVQFVDDHGRNPESSA
ncbi:MAG: helix-turn-helix domain-containing protein [Armatimonadetes bacterium]|nr:helix-turn-helix domain-containing protein [Armatimonadota bacterium]